MPSDWLFPKPRSTPDDPAAYWPDTGFLELPALPLTDEQVDELERLGAPIASELPFNLGSYFALAEHEQTHWIQMHAFGYGRFQARIDQARTEIAESFFGLFQPEQLRGLLQRRMDGESLLQLDRAQRPLLRRELGPIAARLQQHWWALGLLRHELDTADHALGLLESSRFRLGLSVLYAEAGPEISRVALLEEKVLQEAALARAPTEELGKVTARSQAPSLSAAAIAECSAVLNQHWFYAHQAEACRRGDKESDANVWWSTLVRSWESKELTFYGDAFTVYSDLNPTLDLNATIPLATLGVLCAVALDGQFSVEHPDAQRWEDLAPPLRFIALARAVGKVGLLPAHSVCALDPADYHGYVKTLCDAAEVAAPAPYPSERLSPSAWGRSLTNHLRYLHHDAATAAATLVQRIPAAIVAPSEANVYRGEELLTNELSEFRLAREAPLLSLGGVASSIGLDEDRFWRCGVAGAYQRVMLQLFADPHRLRMSGLPTCARGMEMITKALEVAEVVLDTPIPIAR